MRLLPSFLPHQDCIPASSPHDQDCPDGLKPISDQVLSVVTCANRRRPPPRRWEANLIRKQVSDAQNETDPQGWTKLAKVYGGSSFTHPAITVTFKGIIATDIRCRSGHSSTLAEFNVLKPLPRRSIIIT